MKKRVLSLLLALVMVLSVFPMTVFADGEAETAETTEAIEEIVEEVAEENEEEIPEEETEPEEEPEEEVFESVPAANATTGAVAYVTVGEGEAAELIQASDFDDLTTEGTVEEAGYFKTLAAAIAACPTGGTQATIKMLKGDVFDGNAGWTIKNGQNIVIDLNGKTLGEIVKDPAWAQAFYIEYGATLTIDDTSDGQKGIVSNTLLDPEALVGEWWETNPITGEVLNDGYQNWSTNIITNKGTFIFNGGTLRSNGQGSIAYGIDSHGGSTVEINGGLVYDDYGSAVRLAHAYTGYKNIDFTMTGGQIGVENGGGSAIWSQSYSDGTGTYNISGGTIYANSYAALYNDTENHNIVWNISGGTLVCNYITLWSLGATVNITGGEILNKTSDACYAIYAQKGTILNISGGTVKSDTEYGIYARQTSKVNVTGGSISGSYGVLLAEGSSLDVKGGRINSSHPIYQYNDESVSITGGYFSTDVSSYLVDPYKCVPNKDTYDQVSADKGENAILVDKDETGLKYKIGNGTPTQAEAEACIIRGEQTIYCWTIADACAQAVSGDTVKVLVDNAVMGGSSIYINGSTVENLTIDLNGYEVINETTYGFDADYGAEVLIKNGTITGGKKALYIESGSQVTIENVEITSDASDCVYMWGGGELILADDSVNHITTTASNYPAIWGSYMYEVYNDVSGNGTLYVEGDYSGIYAQTYTQNSKSYYGGIAVEAPNVYAKGTQYGGLEYYGYYYSYVSAGYYANDVSDYCAEDYVCVFNTDEYTKEEYPYTVKAEEDLTEEDYVASVTTGGETKKYISLPAAIAAAQNGSTVTLLKDTMIDGGSYVEITKDITLDLNYNKVTNNTDNGFYFYNHKVTVKNGTVTGEGNAFRAQGGATLTLDGVTAESTGNAAVLLEKSNLEAAEGSTNTIESTATNGDGILAKQASTIGGTGTIYAEGTQSAIHAYGEKNYNAELTVTNPNLFATNSKTSGANNTRALYLSIEKGSGTTTKAVLYAGVYENDVEAYCAENYGIVHLTNEIDGYEGYYQVTQRGLKLNQEPVTVVEGEDGQPDTYKLGEEAIEVEKPEGIESDDVTEKLNDLLDNETVATYVKTEIDKATSTSETKIKDKLKEEVDKDELGEEEAQAIKDNIDSMIDMTKKINVDLTTAKIETIQDIGEQVTSTTSITESTYKVKPVATITTTDANGESVTYKTVIPNEAITSPISFVLPIDKGINAQTAAVYHWPEDDTKKENVDFVGIKNIETATNGDKYIALSAKEFSFYSIVTMTNVSESAVAVIKSVTGDTTSYTGFDTLADAIAAFNAGTDEDNSTVDNAVAIILLKELANVNSNFADKELELDLNGYKFEGKVTNATKVTVTNSDVANQTTLAAVGTYANDVSAFAADGYDTKKTTIDNDTLFLPTNADYRVIVEAEPTGSTVDRDTTTVKQSKWKVIGDEEQTYDTKAKALAAAGNDATKVQKIAWLDLYAGDKIKVTVKVEGARFAAADVTLTFDPANFKVSAPKTGWTAVKNEAGETVGYRFYDYYQGDAGYFENGEVLGTFTFTVKEGDSEKLNELIKVSTSDTYVAKAWKDGWNSNPADKLGAGQLLDESVNIRLKQMTASVTPNTGLVYKEINQKLLADGYTAKDNLSEAAINDATITYAVLTKEEAEGVLFTGAEGQVQSTSNPDYVEGMEPKVPAKGDYGNSMMKTDAGDYVVFWKIEKLGYVTVTGKENVSIAPLDVKLEWTMPKDKTEGEAGEIIATAVGAEDGLGNPVTADFWGNYTQDGFVYSDTTVWDLVGVATQPTYTDKNMHAHVKALNKYRTPTITMTEWPETATEGELKAVGTYKFKADLGSNYHILNDEIEVLIDGGVITGYDLVATAETIDGGVYFDGQSHVAAKLQIADNADPATENVTKKYRYSSDDGENWSNWQDEIPSFTAANAIPYKIQMQLSADNYYTDVKEYEFSVKPVIYYAEKNDYVTGWDLVLCYTDEEVPSFTYDGKQMFDVSAFGYKLGSAWSDESGKTQTVAGTEYKHVYGIVVEGNADINLVLPSNTKLYTGNNKAGHVEHKIELSEKGRMDVNMSISIDINDLVAVASVYNVDRSYLASTDESVIAIVLRADVNGNKTVNTYDCSLIKTNTGK